MKKIVLLVFLVYFFNCEAQLIKEQEQVIKSLSEQVFLKERLNNRIRDYGILYKELDSYNYILNYDFETKLKKGNVFQPNIDDSIIEELFNEESVNYYLKQIEESQFDLSKIEFFNEKIVSFSDEIEDKYANHKKYKINISKPVFSLDSNYAVIFSNKSHDMELFLFRRNKSGWSYLGVYNMMFPRI